MNSIAGELRGMVQLDHKTQPVDIVYNTFSSQESIKIGDDTFELSGEGSHHFEGRRNVAENRRVLVDENVSVEMDPKNIANAVKQGADFADYLDLANKDEFHFTPGDNALIIRSDNINGTFLANFAHLDPVSQPGDPS